MTAVSSIIGPMAVAGNLPRAGRPAPTAPVEPASFATEIDRRLHEERAVVVETEARAREPPLGDEPHAPPLGLPQAREPPAGLPQAREPPAGFPQAREPPEGAPRYDAAGQPLEGHVRELVSDGTRYGWKTRRAEPGARAKELAEATRAAIEAEEARQRELESELQATWQSGYESGVRRSFLALVASRGWSLTPDLLQRVESADPDSIASWFNAALAAEDVGGVFAK